MARKRLAIIGKGMGTRRLLDELVQRKGHELLEITVYGADRLVCNGHEVSESAIRAAFEAGSESIEALGQVTKAGTGCGSCKTDLGQLITSLRKPAPALDAAG